MAHVTVSERENPAEGDPWSVGERGVIDTHERRLWLGVLDQVLRDLGSVRRDVREAAERWCGDRAAMEWVAMGCGVDADALARTLRRYGRLPKRADVG